MTPKGFLQSSRALHKHFKPSVTKVGVSPGTLIYTGHQNQTTAIQLIQYDAGKAQVFSIHDKSQLKKLLKPDEVSWVKVSGFENLEMIGMIGNVFSIDPMIMEDVVQTGTVPKIEIHSDHIFISMKQITVDEVESQFNLSHFSIILTTEALLTFAETPLPIFDTLQERIQNDQSQVRRMPASFLCYRVLDTVVDYYSLVLEWFTNHIADLEEEMVERPSKKHIHSILALKKQWLLLRRALIPLREELRSAVNTDSELVNSLEDKYLSDIMDHLNDLTETLEIIHASLDNLMELNNSTINNRINEVMQVLTIITSIFIPITFIAGIYGMNFENMPETRWPNGYFYALGLMATIALSMVAYMKKRKWF